MLSDKHLNPLLLVPDNKWGTRIKETFSEQWQNLGQDVTSIQVYNSKERDF